MTGNRNLLFVLAIALFGLAKSQGQTNPVHSNTWWIAHLATQPILNWLEDRAPDSSSVVIQDRDASGVSHWLVLTLQDSCLKKNFHVYKSTDSPLNSALQIAVEQVAAHVEYRAIHKWLGLWTSAYHRDISVRYHVQITGAGGAVLWSELIQQHHQDTISATGVAALEDPLLPFTKGKKLPQTTYKKLVEPIVISAATITVVVLFYTLRSGKR